MRNLIILAVALLFWGSGQTSINANFTVENEVRDEAYIIFMRTIHNILQEEHTGDVSIHADKEVIYDIN